MEFGDLRAAMNDRQDTLASRATGGPSLRVLNRTISINIGLDVIVLEPDQFYVSKMVEELGLADSKSMNTPRLKPDLEAHLQTGSAKTLEPETATLAQDRVDRSESVELKRLARYLLGNIRCALVFPRQSTEGEDFQVHVGSD